MRKIILLFVLSLSSVIYADSYKYTRNIELINAATDGDLEKVESLIKRR